MSSDEIRMNVRNTASIIAIVAFAGGVISMNAIAHDRLARAEARIQTLEDKVTWQNEILWEIRGDIKELRASAVRHKGDLP
jgi:hypothetical protein